MTRPLADEPAPLLPRPARAGTWRVLDRLAVATAVTALLVPALLLATGRRPGLIENRPLLSPPPVSASRLLDTSFYAAVDAYLADNVALRTTAVRLRSFLDAGLLGGNVDRDVIRGTDGWLFSRSELVPQCSTTADQTEAAFDELAAAAQAAGRDLHVVLIPDKHAIYPDRLDTGSGLPTPCTDERRPAIRAWSADHPALAVDGWGLLLQARGADADGAGLYYAQDTHWTPSGARPVIERLIRGIDPSVWDPADVVRTGKLSRRVDLAAEQGLPRTEAVPRLLVRPDVKLDRTTIPVSVPLTHAPAIYRFTPRSSGHPTVPGRTAIVYDSFFGSMKSMVAPYFAESVWIHVNDLEAQPSLAPQLGPFDHVIYARVERGLYETNPAPLLMPLVAPEGDAPG